MDDLFDHFYTQDNNLGDNNNNLGDELTFPTAEKKSSRSRALILAASCMQKTVRASLSSGVRLSIGCLERGEKKQQC